MLFRGCLVLSFLFFDTLQKNFKIHSLYLIFVFVFFLFSSLSLLLVLNPTLIQSTKFLDHIDRLTKVFWRLIPCSHSFIFKFSHRLDSLSYVLCFSIQNLLSFRCFVPSSRRPKICFFFYAFLSPSFHRL